MATQEKLTFIIEAEDRAKVVLQNLEGSFTSFNDKIKANIGTITAVTATAGVAFGALAMYSKGAVQGAIDQETVQARLKNIIQTSTQATDAQVDALIRQADALEQTGVVSAGTINQLQGQLASFDLQYESIEKLTPALLDYVVAEKGLNATTGDAQAIANGFAQAMQGNFSALTKAGFVLDDATKALIQNGTEAERTENLVKVLNSTYKGFNEQMRNTTEGGMVGMQFAMDKLNDSIGSALLPVVNSITQALAPLLQKFATFAEENPRLVATILIVVGALAGLTVVIGTVALAMTALSVVSLPIVGIIAGIVLAVGAIIAIFIYWKDITNWLGQVFYDTFEAIKNKLQEWWASITATVTSIWNSIKEVIDAIVNGFKLAWETIKQVTVAVFEFIKNYFTIWGLASKLITLENMKAIHDGIVEAWTAIKNFFLGIWDSIKGVFQSAINYINGLIDSFMAKVEAIMNAISRVGSAIGSGISNAVSSVTGIFRRATGGSVTPNTPYVVGENGQELFVPNTYGSILNQGQLAGLGAGITINISGNSFMGKEGIAESIGDELVKILRLNTKL
jgi:phage-related tail protein